MTATGVSAATAAGVTSATTAGMSTTAAVGATAATRGTTTAATVTRGSRPTVARSPRSTVVRNTARTAVIRDSTRTGIARSCAAIATIVAVAAAGISAIGRAAHDWLVHIQLRTRPAVGAGVRTAALPHRTAGSGAIPVSAAAASTRRW